MTPSQDILKPLDNNDNRSGVMKLAPIVKMDTNIVMSNGSINVNQIDILPAEVWWSIIENVWSFFFIKRNVVCIVWSKIGVFVDLLCGRYKHYRVLWILS